MFAPSQLFEDIGIGDCGRAEADRKGESQRRHTLHFGFHSRANRCASAVWAGVMCAARLSRRFADLSRVSPDGKWDAARLSHICA